MPTRSGTPTGQTPPKPTISAPNTVLEPAVHWDHDLDGLPNLSPSTSGSLYYSEGGTNDPSVPAMVAHLRVNFTFPAVVLEHSSLVVDVKCNPGDLEIVLSSQEASQHALDSWSSGSIILVTHTSGCGSSVDGQRIYYLVESVKLTESTITAGGHQIAIEEALIDAEVVWGNYVPAGSSTVGHAPTSGSLGPTTAPIPTSGSGSPIASSGSSTANSNSNTFDAFGTSSSEALPAPTSITSAVPCGSPSASTLNGLPAAPCEDAFDLSLDNALGYYSVDNEHFAATFADIAPGAAYSDSGNSTTKRSFHGLQKRWGISSVVSSVSHAVTSTVSTVVNTVATVVPAVVTQAAHTVVQSSFVEELEGILDQILPDSQGQPEPGIVFWCVNCGIRGTIQVAGSISFTLLNGVTAGNVALSGNLRAGLEIGMDAFAEYRKTITVARLVHQGIPGFSITNVITVGPEITLDMTADFRVSAQGQLLAGITANWPNFAANLDMVNPSRSTQSGWVPQVNRIFNVTGTLSASAALGLPLGINFGIDLLAGRYSKSIALVDTPAIEADATFSANYVNVNGVQSVSVNQGTCPGVAWTVGLTNKLELNVLDLRTYPLYNWASPPLADGCITVSFDNVIHPIIIDLFICQNIIYHITVFYIAKAVTLIDELVFFHSSVADIIVIDPVVHFNLYLIIVVYFIFAIIVELLLSGSLYQLFIINNLFATNFIEFKLSYQLVVVFTIIIVIVVVVVVVLSIIIIHINFEQPIIDHPLNSNHTLALAFPCLPEFQVHCGQDIPGYDLTIAVTSTGIPDCIEKCKNVANCQAVTYVPSRSLSCYFKPVLNPYPYAVQSFECDSAIVVARPAAVILQRQGTNYTQDGPPPDSISTDDDSPASDLDNGSDSTPYTFPDIAADTFNVTALPTDLNAPADSSTSVVAETNDGISYSSLTDLAHSYQLSGSSDGNLHLVSSSTPDSGSSFASSAGVYYGDSQDRIFHYYAPEMSTYGVSRFRLAPLDHMPLTSRLVTLAPIDHDNDPSTPSIIVAADTLGNAFYLFACTLDGQSKIFLVQNPSSGGEVLEREELKFTITGGVVADCGPVVLTSPQAGFGTGS
ncbi:MAG: hypothetical protein Q9218_002633 [Villophora microphyllina]